MAARVGLLLRVLPLLLWGGLDAQRVGRELRREAEAFLEKYGYLSDQGPSRPSSTRFSNAIREFQWVSQLPVSGVLDPPTLRQMMQPRCGVADTDSQMPWTERVSALFAGRRAKMRRKKRFARQGEEALRPPWSDLRSPGRISRLGLFIYLFVIHRDEYRVTRGSADLTLITIRCFI
uniref:Matrix metallopeptidase 28 n=1 Tax=Ovis aries TaxID=9940 RepID=A0AC11EJI0_SHEEP